MKIVRWLLYLNCLNPLIYMASWLFPAQYCGEIGKDCSFHENPVRFTKME